MKLSEILIAVIIFIFISGICSCKHGKRFYKEKLIKTDQAFSNYSQEHGMEEAFLKYLAEDAVLLKGNRHPVIGIGNIKKLYQESDDSKIQLTWEPNEAIISESGDLGYTYGTYTLLLGDEVKRGTYVSIWRLGDDGNYELVLDTGNEGLGE